MQYFKIRDLYAIYWFAHRFSMTNVNCAIYFQQFTFKRHCQKSCAATSILLL